MGDMGPYGKGGGAPLGLKCAGTGPISEGEWPWFIGGGVLTGTPFGGWKEGGCNE